MKKYFAYLMKKNILFAAVLTLFCVLMYVVPVTTNSYGQFVSQTRTYLSYLSVALGTISVLIPVYMFAYRMNKRSVDMHFSLPISRTKVFAARFIAGLVIMYIAYSVAFLWGYVTFMIRTRGAENLHYIYGLWFYLATIIPAFIPYAVTVFAFTRANTIVDGIITAAGIICLLVVAASGVGEVLHSSVREVTGNSMPEAGVWQFFPFEPLSKATDSLSDALVSGKLETAPAKGYSHAKFVGTIVSTVLWTVIAAAATVFCLTREKVSKAENCAQISESPFSYRSLVPAYAFFLAAVTRGNVTACLAIAFAALVASIVYKRSIKIGKNYAIILAACFVAGIFIGLIPRLL